MNPVEYALLGAGFAPTLEACIGVLASSRTTSQVEKKKIISRGITGIALVILSCVLSTCNWR